MRPYLPLETCWVIRRYARRCLLLGRKDIQCVRIPIPWRALRKVVRGVCEKREAVEQLFYRRWYGENASRRCGLRSTGALGCIVSVATFLRHSHLRHGNGYLKSSVADAEVTRSPIPTHFALSRQKMPVRATSISTTPQA